MKERPIIFSGPMVRAILDGKKTQTRRVLKPQPDFTTSGAFHWSPRGYDHYGTRPMALADVCPYGMEGDRLYIREKTYGGDSGQLQDLCYAVACPCGLSDDEHAKIKGWKPSIHMPRWASRITLEIVDVRVERVQDISEGDVEAEGVALQAWAGEGPEGWPKTAGFAWLWDSINGKKHSWADNPWVWVIDFKVAA